ncbi:MAG: hypothetical protein J4A00_01495 [Gammaproteobacteria bacterium]|nr:hypothetical protein [Gammaproteobacteria bacterium]
MSSTTALWPRALNTLSADDLEPLAMRLAPMVGRLRHEIDLPADDIETLRQIQLPLAAWLAYQQKTLNRTLLVGLNGAQGSGKSTLCRLLIPILSEGFGLKACTLSLDDIYLTRAARAELAETRHPLFATRGVPGTHDLPLGYRVIRQLRTAGAGERVAIPRFDKAIDDRQAESTWPEIEGPVDIILFEGWCIGATAQDSEALENPVNPLERDDDADGRWRRQVNSELAGPYARFFSMLDLLIMIKVPGMGSVLEWRSQQERELGNRRGSENTAVMDHDKLVRFIMHYERLTRHMLTTLPLRADLTMELDQSHQVVAIRPKLKGR